MCVDIRLQSNPNLDVVFENTVECLPSYIEESMMEIAHTNCPISIDHEVAGSPVTRVPKEPAPLVEEIFTAEDECVGSRESSPAFVSKKRRLPLRHVQQKAYSETADKRARLSPEVKVISCELSVVSIFLAATSKTGRSSIMFNSPFFLGYSVM